MGSEREPDMKRYTALIAAFVLTTALTATAANATIGIYDYVGSPINCVGVESSCTVKPAVTTQLTASFTFAIDFDQSYAGDQTLYAFRYGFHFVSDWSITNGTYTLSSAQGDILDPNSEFTHNGNTIRTWIFSASNASNTILFNSAPHFDITSIGGTVLVGRSPAGTWTTGGGVVPTGTVPEPAAWALLLTGFGLTGAAMRRRDRSLAA